MKLHLVSQTILGFLLVALVCPELEDPVGQPSGWD